MPKLRRRVRKLAARAVRHEVVQRVAEKLITAAILATIAKLSQSRTAKKLANHVMDLAQSGQAKPAAGGKRAAKSRSAKRKRS